MQNRSCEKRACALVRAGRAVLCALAVVAAILPLRAAAQMNTTTVQGTVYRADGTAASGTMIVSWSAFTTPQNQAVAAGSLNAAIGANGFVSVNLTPNAGALPAGSYYTVVYHLSDGTVSREYWVVPQAATAAIATVRAQLEPSTVAVQAPVTAAYVQSALASAGGSYLPLAGGTLTGPLTLSADPTSTNQAATKHYADELAAAALPLADLVSGQGDSRTPSTNASSVAMTHYVAGHVCADDYLWTDTAHGGTDIGAAINAAVQAASLTAQTEIDLCTMGSYNVYTPIVFDRPVAFNMTGSRLIAQTPLASTPVAIHNATLTAGSTVVTVSGGLPAGLAAGMRVGGTGTEAANTIACVYPNAPCTTPNTFQIALPAELDVNGTLSTTSTTVTGLSSMTGLAVGQTLQWQGAGSSYSAPIAITALNFANQSLTLASTPTSTGNNPTSLTVGGSWTTTLTAVKVTYVMNWLYNPNALHMNEGQMIGGRMRGVTIVDPAWPSGRSLSGVGGVLLAGWDDIDMELRVDNLDGPGLTVGGPGTFTWLNAQGVTDTSNHPVRESHFWAPKIRDSGDPLTRSASIEITTPPQAPFFDQNNQLGFVGGEVGFNYANGVVIGSYYTAQAPPSGPRLIWFTDNFQAEGGSHVPNQNIPAPFDQILIENGHQLWFSGDELANPGYGKATVKCLGCDQTFVTSSLVTAAGKQITYTVSATAGSPTLTWVSGGNNGFDPTGNWDGVGVTLVDGVSCTTASPCLAWLAPSGAVNGAGTQLTLTANTPTVTGRSVQMSIGWGGMANFNFAWPGVTQFQAWEDAWTDAESSAQSLLGENAAPQYPGYFAGGFLAAEDGKVTLSGLPVSASSLALTGSAAVQGGVTGATINGEFTVDGRTYSTVNAAWSAAAAQATASGQNQTVRLGPGSYPVTATLTEPANGACVSLIGSAGSTMTADSTQIATMLTVPSSLGGDVIFLGNAAQDQSCTFKDFDILAAGNATHGFELQWYRGALIDNVAVNDTTAEGILLGEENTASGHQANALLRNVVVSYSSATFTPASRAAYGVHLQKTAMDSHLDDVLVRNALTAAVYNEGTGNTGYLIHGFGYPYSCTTAPCANNATSGSAANASYATSYVIYDTGGSGSVWTDTYADSPAVAGFYVGANGIAIHGGHIQWPDLTSFPSANLAYVASGVSNNLLIADVDCLEMNSGVNWITYAGASGNPPTFSSVHHLTGCGNYYQALEPAEVTGFSSGGANINDPSGAVPRVWSTPIAAASSYPAYSAQLYTGYQGDAFQAHFSGAAPFFNVTYQGTIRSSGGIALGTTINTASTLTLTAANKNVIANAASGPQTITLPSCYTPFADQASPAGLEFTIVKSDPSSNAVTLATTSSELIYSRGTGAATLVLASPTTETLVCGTDYNWYAAASGSGVATFNGRTGTVTPASGDYSFSQLSGQATNAQLPSTLSAPTTGNAATATALAATPPQCATGYYATGITAGGAANCLQSWHFTWYGSFGGTFGSSTNNSLGAIWSPTAAITMTRLDIAVGTAPAGCTTYPVVGIYDGTSATWLRTVTLASGTYSYRNAVSGVSITAGHNLSMGVQTAGVGCTTSPASAQLTMEYTMNQ